MKKEVSFSSQGQRADIGDIIIYRILPNWYAKSVGPFVFLDHIAPTFHAPDKPLMKNGTGAHPHRGIATLTYLLHGEGEHFDSAGHHAKVSSGGIQWMKAGNGIIHDENLNVDSQAGNRLTHGLQFWINLSSKAKAESPDYLAVQAEEVPQKLLDDGAGWLKVIAGSYENLVSRIPSYTDQFLYHVHLEVGKTLSIETKDGQEYAAFLLESYGNINDTAFNAGDFIEFGRKEGSIEISSSAEATMDLILFGGEKYMEPIVSEGPFVMNSRDEIVQAYRDFFNGKYGQIVYNN
ncbi:pirin family protein [Pontibacter sp. 13R65]|uniref:pirin family protein n=1 Tax=Pontibacter sp. 13R65 TaxID=3127458 RepID=UPI00301CF12C